jgi:predicted phosphoadenosine phosphosulfate sulfurtransferase
MATQRYTGETVLAAARRRIAFVFDHFDEVICSISGGKDSTALAHLALSEAHRRGVRIGLFLLDEEVLYQSSVEQVEYLMSIFPENTKRMWMQIPFRLTNATSVVEGQLNCWEPLAHKVWMRPRRSDSIKGKPWPVDSETVANKAKGFGFYDAIANFERCHPGACFLVGLRAAGESPNRWRAVTKNPVEIGGQRVFWGTRKGESSTLYPIYDWNFHDVWRYIWDEGLKYSRIYDLQWRKGYGHSQMRVSSLIHERAFKSICDLPEFEPKTYNKLVKRIKGIAMAQETGRNAKLFRCAKLPKNHKTWRSYRDFLLSTHSDRDRVGIFCARFARQLDNEYVARQQCRQLLLNDYENNLPIDSRPDPREELIAYYKETL